jgi:sugar phosphate isomerase/epimerase
MASALPFLIPFGWLHRTEKVQFALAHGYGLEIGVFASGDAVDDPYVRADYESRLTSKLRRFPGPLTMHGAFMDLAIHSGDACIAHHSRERIHADIQLAIRLGCQKLVFHTGYNPLIPAASYRERFLAAHVEFWPNAAAAAAGSNLTLCLENQWENDPSILQELMRRIDLPNVRLCLDVGHAHAYSDVAALTWLTQLTPFLAHMHWSDNLGNHDSHLPLGMGSINWAALVDSTLRLPAPPSIVIELNTLRAIERSFSYLQEVSLNRALTAPQSLPSLTPALL